MATFLDGIGTSQNIDSSGERISVAGMDISTLAYDGVFTYEHEIATNEKGEKISIKFPEQTVGKILKAKKIFSADDCDDDRELYFWNKVQTPFVYIMGELFDDYTDAARDLAGKLRYDADHKGQNKHNVINFSIEGRYVAKEGMEVTKSIARKCTITTLPCNKAALAELVPQKRPKGDDMDSLFKTEQTEVEFFKPTSDYMDFLAKKEEDMKKLEAEVGGIMEKSWSAGKPSRDALHFSHPEHGTVSIHKQPGGEYHVKHQGAMAGLKGVTGAFKSPQEAGQHAKNYMAAITQKKILPPKPQNHPSPQMAGKFTMNKAMEAGSGMAAPSQLVQGAALAAEKVSKKMKKSKWLARAEQSYKTWEKKEEFRSFMKKSMPHLALGEIDAIGQVIALRKSLEAEQNLSKMVSEHYEEKKEDKK